MVLVTGASRGIGAALTTELASMGAQLVLTARNEKRLRQLAQDLTASGTNCTYAVADVRDQKAVEQVVHHGFDCFGRIDVLINNAGIGLRGPVASLQPVQLAEAFAVNVGGPLYFIQATVPFFERQGSGLIINISSLGAVQAAPNIGGYAATKAALAKLGNTLQLELHSSGIRTCTAYPGSARTEFRNHALGEKYLEKEPRLSRVAPQLVAKRILKRAATGKGDIYITTGDWLLARLAGVAPSVAKFLVGWVFQHGRDNSKS